MAYYTTSGRSTSLFK